MTKGPSISSILALVLAASVVACERDRPEAAAPKVRAETKPPATNVLLITIDTLRADAVGVYGQSRVVTPHLDAFASEGVLFENAVSSSPSTLASHASIFTGRHPYAHGVRSNTGYALGDSEFTLAETLEAHGYRTRGEVSSDVLSRETGLDQGFDEFQDVESSDVELLDVHFADGDWQREAELRARPAIDVSSHGIRFLESVAAADDPFFLWLHYFDPHFPHVPAALQGSLSR